MSSLASYFALHYDDKNSNYIILSDKSISTLLKVRSKTKSLYIYEYGCIVFVDFTIDEIHPTMAYLEKITGTIDYKHINIFNENLILSISSSQFITKINDVPCILEYNNDVLSIACSLVAKSVALSAVETEIVNVLDDAGNLVNYLQKAKLRIKTRKFVSSISLIARFQYRIIKPLDLFDNSFLLKKNSNSRNFYSIVHNYYEIDDRTSILESKIDQVNKILSNYTTHSYNIGEIRLLIFECILLAMFLLPHIIDFKAILKLLTF